MHLLQRPRFSAFLLAVHHLHEVLPKLWNLILESNRGRLEIPLVLDRFQVRLDEFFDTCRRENPRLAAQELGKKIHELTDLVRGMDRQAGKLWKEYVEKIHAGAAAWDCDAHMEELHQKGRNAAREFFNGCAVLQNRLNTVCPLNTLGEATDSGKPRMKYSESLGIDSVFYFGGSKESYYHWYVALPFRFVHEYTAHIFAIDAGFEYFSDGWMMEAAGEFIRTCQITREPDLGFSEAQADFFEKEVRPPMLKMETPGLMAAGRGLKAAAATHSKLDVAKVCDRRRFFELTLALCSFDPEVDRLKRLKRMMTLYLNIERLAHTDGILIATKLNDGVEQFLKEMAVERK